MYKKRRFFNRLSKVKCFYCAFIAGLKFFIANHMHLIPNIKTNMNPAIAFPEPIMNPKIIARIAGVNAVHAEIFVVSIIL